MPKSHLRLKLTKVLALVLGLLSVFHTHLHAQHQTEVIDPTYISVAEGLVSPTVNAVIQDSFGLIWIGTSNGLQKYDGYRFETFKNVSGKSTSLLHNYVWSLWEDENHDIWVSNGKGVSKYNRKRNEFKNYEFARIFNFTLDSQVLGFKFLKDSQNRLWVNSINLQLLQYDSVADTWQKAKYEIPNVPEPDQTGFAPAVAEDLKGNIWMGSPNYGLMKLAKSEAAFKPLPQVQLGDINFTEEGNTISGIFCDTANTLWITTRSGIYKYNPEAGTIKTIKEYIDAQTDIYTNLNSILPDPQGNIWIANNFRGMLKFDGISDSYTEIEIAGKVRMRTHGWNITFTQFMIDRSGIFWFGSREEGLVKYDPVNKPFRHLSPDKNNPNSMSAGGTFGILASKVKPGITYVGIRGGGINMYDPKKQNFKKITYKVVDDMFGGSARSIAEKKDGSLWLGTWGDGLIELDKNYNEVRRFKYDSTTKASISNNQVRVLKPDSHNRLWIGTVNGLNILNTQTNEIERVISRYTKQYPDQLVAQLDKLIATDQNVAAIEKVIDSQNLSAPLEVKTESTYWIMAVGEIDRTSRADFAWIENEAKDTVWLMGDYENTFHAGGASKNRIEITSITLPAGQYTLRYLTDDSHAYGKWNEPAPTQTSLYGVVVIQPQGEDQMQAYQEPVDPEGKDELMISGVDIKDIEVADQFVWVASDNNGLDRIDPGTNSVKHYAHNPADANSLSSNGILDILADSHGNIWLATNEGVTKLDPRTETFTRYTEVDGLPTNLIEGLVEGDDGEMWIATRGGLSQMVINENLNKETFINYNSSDGLGTDVFLSLANTRDAEGRFYFGGEHGLTTFSSISANKTPPAIIISDLLISNKSILDMGDDSPLTESLFQTESITFAHNQNNLSFEFAALHYANPQKNQYAHMLKGYDQDWIYDNRNFAAYTNLDPGKYEFLIRASNAYGIWNEEGKILSIVVLPPWWKTWWAYGLYVMIFLFAGVSIDRGIRRRIKLRERERNREKELKHAKEIEIAYTNLKETQSQLIQSEKMASLGELTAGIAHEIQNPLNFVNNFSEVNKELIEELQEELKAGRTQEAIELSNDIKDNEEKIMYHGKRADSIVKGMLQHSRSSNGVKEPTDLNVLADEYLRLAYHGLRAKDKTFNATMHTDFEKGLEKIEVIPQDLGRVILNLITNAFYVVAEKKRQIVNGYDPTVTVATKDVGDKVEISVTDNGNGIPQSIIDKIFQPFFTTKPSGQGTGLGLSMSYEIITKSHGGDLKVETKEGDGTTFKIILPKK